MIASPPEHCEQCDAPGPLYRSGVHAPGLFEGTMLLCWKCAGYSSPAEAEEMEGAE